MADASRTDRWRPRRVVWCLLLLAMVIVGGEHLRRWEQARRYSRRALADLQTVSQALHRFTEQRRDRPDAALAQLFDPPPDDELVRPADPWGRSYRFRRVGERPLDLVVLSAGPDGATGTEDDIRLHVGDSAH